jgi:hypothetical protein
MCFQTIENLNLSTKRKKKKKKKKKEKRKKDFLAGVSLFIDFRLTRYPSALPYLPKVGTLTFFVHGRLHIVNKLLNPIIFLIDSLLKYT